MKLSITASAADDAIDFALRLANTDDPMRQPPDLLAEGAGASDLLGPYLEEGDDPARIAKSLIPFRDVLRDGLRDLADRDVSPERTRARLSGALELPWQVTHPTPSEVSFAPYGTALQRIEAWAALGYFALPEGAKNRLRVCGSPPCEEIFRDGTKSGRQKFCSKRCANRVNVSRYRDRERSGHD